MSPFCQQQHSCCNRIYRLTSKQLLTATKSNLAASKHTQLAHMASHNHCLHGSTTSIRDPLQGTPVPAANSWGAIQAVLRQPAGVFGNFLKTEDPSKKPKAAIPYLPCTALGRDHCPQACRPRQHAGWGSAVNVNTVQADARMVSASHACLMARPLRKHLYVPGRMHTAAMSAA